MRQSSRVCWAAQTITFKSSWDTNGFTLHLPFHNYPVKKFDLPLPRSPLQCWVWCLSINGQHKYVAATTQHWIGGEGDGDFTIFYWKSWCVTTLLKVIEERYLRTMESAPAFSWRLTNCGNKSRKEGSTHELKLCHKPARRISERNCDDLSK